MPRVSQVKREPGYFPGRRMKDQCKDQVARARTTCGRDGPKSLKIWLSIWVLPFKGKGKLWNWGILSGIKRWDGEVEWAIPEAHLLSSTLVLRAKVEAWCEAQSKHSNPAEILWAAPYGKSMWPQIRSPMVRIYPSDKLGQKISENVCYRSLPTRNLINSPASRKLIVATSGKARPPPCLIVQLEFWCGHRLFVSVAL